MKLNKILLFIIALALQQAAYGWIAKVQVMQHPKTKHVVRLASDIHAAGVYTHYKSNVDREFEGDFFVQVEKPLKDFLEMDRKEGECFVIEQTPPCTSKDFSFYGLILLYGQNSDVPLLRRLNMFCHKGLSETLKFDAMKIKTCRLFPQIDVVAYDARCAYQEILEDIINNHSKKIVTLFEQHQRHIMNDIVTFTKQKYGTVFGEYIKKKGELILRDLFMHVENPKTANVHQFFLGTYADFAYLAYIGQNAYKNMTLYLGADHCDVLAKDLENMGYETIFVKGQCDTSLLSKGVIPGPIGKDEYEEFFTTGRMKF